MSDITLVNLNMLYMRYGSTVDRELHVPLGPLYLARALMNEGFAVDFRDYQAHESDDPFAVESLLDFLEGPADVIGLSCMANLLPFTIRAVQAIKERWPEKRVIVGGVGPKSVERAILERFPWITTIVRGEAERTLPALLRALDDGADLREVSGLTYRENGAIHETPDAPRIEDLDSLGYPAFELVDLGTYDAYGMITSRGCPYPCTFCSVAPVWDHTTKLRTNADVIAEMRYLHEKAGVELFLFQDEFFVSSSARARAFCRDLKAAGLPVRWKAFGRVNLTDEETMREMATAGCVELRYGIESGSDRILEKTKKGFTSAQAVDVVTRALSIFPRVDVFYVWGFPFETMEDFHRSVFQMISFRSLGARVLPSLLSLLPQTEIYEELEGPEVLEFCPELFPEYMLTGHEVLSGGRVVIPDRHRPLFEMIRENPDIFPGFFHVDLEKNIRPKLAVLREMGFYPALGSDKDADSESCGAHSAKIATG